MRRHGRTLFRARENLFGHIGSITPVARPDLTSCIAALLWRTGGKRADIRFSSMGHG